ncbi:hypothetical protein BDZ89DRAFT_1073535 [Hymenopellis radicata]|nr:hypothetical protein BDZ89DRAFT_1073535 [Hymenopellis radicata]
MSAAKENRRVVLKLPKHVPSKLVREEKPLLSAPKTKLILRIPLKRKRGENEDLDELEDCPIAKSIKQEPFSEGFDLESCEAADITESEEDTDESPRGAIDLLPPVQLKYFASRKNPCPPAVGGVKLPHDFNAPFKPHFSADKRKLHSRCNITIDLTFKRVPCISEVAARWRVPPELMVGWEVRRRWLEGEEWMAAENFKAQYGMCRACRAKIEPLDGESGTGYDYHIGVDTPDVYVDEWIKHRGTCLRIRAKEQERKVPFH